MKVLEVGLVCEFEGGHGALIADSDSLLTDTKMYLLGVLSRHLKDMELLYSDNANAYEVRKIKALKKECQWTQEKIKKSKDIESLRRIVMDESSMRVMIKEREVLGGGR